jgi:hypothetical protein
MTGSGAFHTEITITNVTRRHMYRLDPLSRDFKFRSVVCR